MRRRCPHVPAHRTTAPPPASKQACASTTPQGKRSSAAAAVQHGEQRGGASAAAGRACAELAGGGKEGTARAEAGRGQQPVTRALGAPSAASDGRARGEHCPALARTGAALILRRTARTSEHQPRLRDPLRATCSGPAPTSARSCPSASSTPRTPGAPSAILHGTLCLQTLPRVLLCGAGAVHAHGRPCTVCGAGRPGCALPPEPPLLPQQVQELAVHHARGRALDVRVRPVRARLPGQPGPLVRTTHAPAHCCAAWRIPPRHGRLAPRQGEHLMPILVCLHAGTRTGQQHAGCVLSGRPCSGTL